MKFTSKDLMIAMKLKVGDKIKYHNEVFTIVEIPNIGIENDMGCYNIDVLLNKDFEILPRPKRVGQLTCREIKDCRTCPLYWLCFIKINEKDEMKTSLYEMLDSFAVEDQEIYDLLKAKLDKEVVEE